MDQGKAKKLHQWGVKAFQLAQGEPTAQDRSLFVAQTVGREARRLGVTPQELSKWLQTAYGALWVKHSSLNPGLDLKDVRKALLKAYGTEKVEGRGVLFSDAARRSLLEATGQTADSYLQAYMRRHRPMGKIFRQYRLEVKDGQGSAGHGEARQDGEHLIVLYPKFWTLGDDRQRDAVFTHEIGHAVLEQYGHSKFIKLSDGRGVEVWDALQLPYAQHNMHEAFADAFAEYFLNRSDLKRRYPEWLGLVEAVLKGERPGKVQQAPETSSGGPDYHDAAQALLKASTGKTQEDFHYRAYLRAVLQGQPTEHLTKAYEGARRARSDLIDRAGM